MGSLGCYDKDHDCSALKLSAKGGIDVREAFIDASFAPAKKGDIRSERRKRGDGTKIMAVADRNGLPVSLYIESATPHEVTLAMSTLLHPVVPERRRT